MKKLLFFGLLMFLPFMRVHALEASPLTGEHIRSFDSTIIVHPDGSASVTETIVYDFGDQERHGIYRDIPSTKAPGAIDDLKITEATALDEKGIMYPIDVDYSDGLHIKIGDPDRTITGIHTYRIFYTTERSIGYFDTFDELYWNVTGNDWNVPMQNVRARIVLPGIVPVEHVRFASYCGSRGETASCGNVSVLDDRGNTVVEFSSDDFLERNKIFDVYRGMTISVGFPKGLVFEKPLSWWERDTTYYVIAFIGLCIIIGVFIWWIFFRYVPLRRTFLRSVVPEYDPPQDISPSVAGFVFKRGIISVSRIATADLLYLAAEGYITIEVQKVKKFFKNASEFTLSRTEKPFTGTDHVAKLYGFLTQEGKPAVFGKQTDKKLYEKFDSYFKKVKKTADTFSPELVQLRKKYKRIFIWWILLSSICGFVSFIVSAQRLVSPAIIFAFFSISISLIIFFSIRHILQARLIARTDLWYSIAGLKYYIKIAEKDRLKFHGDPENSARIFSSLLPYAVIFGLEDKWVKLFDGVLKELDWYKDPSGRFASDAFLLSIHSFNNSVAHSVNIGRPESSGSSGGGFSGGGGGGGGGGSW